MGDLNGATLALVTHAVADGVIKALNTSVPPEAFINLNFIPGEVDADLFILPPTSTTLTECAELKPDEVTVYISKALTVDART
jgi:hypothetical protein